MIPAVFYRPRLMVENSTTTVRKLVEQASVRKNKILIQLNSF